MLGFIFSALPIILSTASVVADKAGSTSNAYYAAVGSIITAIIAGTFAFLQSKSKNNNDKFSSFMQESEDFRKELREEMERRETKCDEEIKKLKLMIKDQDVLIRVLEERQSLDSKFKVLIDHLPQIVWTAKPDGNVDYYNARGYQFSGRPIHAGRNLGWVTVFHPEDMERGLEIWRQCVETGEPYYYAYRIKRADGVYRWHLGTAIPRINDQGQIIQWVGSCTDIHDYREELLRNAREQLEKEEIEQKTIDNSLS